MSVAPGQNISTTKGGGEHTDELKTIHHVRDLRLEDHTTHAHPFVVLQRTHTRRPPARRDLGRLLDQCTGHVVVAEDVLARCDHSGDAGSDALDELCVGRIWGRGADENCFGGEEGSDRNEASRAHRFPRLDEIDWDSVSWSSTGTKDLPIPSATPSAQAASTLPPMYSIIVSPPSLTPAFRSKSLKYLPAITSNEVATFFPTNPSALVMPEDSGTWTWSLHFPKPSGRTSVICAERFASATMSCPVIPRSTLPSPTKRGISEAGRKTLSLHQPTIPIESSTRTHSAILWFLTRATSNRCDRTNWMSAPEHSVPDQLIPQLPESVDVPLRSSRHFSYNRPVASQMGHWSAGRSAPFLGIAKRQRPSSTEGSIA